MRSRSHQVDERAELEPAHARQGALERRLRSFEEIERCCARQVGIAPGGALDEIGRVIAKWYRDNVPLAICELARKCSREGATLPEAIAALRAELSLGRDRWQHQLRAPVIALPADLDDIEKIAFVLLRTERQSARKLPLSRAQLYRILGPFFPKSLNSQTIRRVSRRPSK
jgi:hypothetical protein